jgi:hypothetical protein
MIMFIRVMRSHFDPSRVGEILHHGSEQLTPTFKRSPGFRTAMAGLDMPGRRLISISSWDTREQAIGVGSALVSLASELEALGLQFEEPEIYEVRE